MPPETSDARLIIDTLSTQPMNEHAEVPRHDQLIRKALRWRRVELRPVGERSLVFVFGGVVVGGMDATVTTLVSAHARRITADPTLLRRHLEIQDIAVAQDPRAAEDEPGSAEESSPGASAAVTLSSSVRVFVVGDRVCAALLLLPAMVLGDGRSTLRELIARDSQARGRHVLLAAPPTQATQPTLHEQPEELARVPEAQELVRLGDSLEMRTGGLSVDVTEAIHESLHELAVEAVAAVPGLNAAAVDLEIPDLGSADGAFVRAVLPDADISPAHFPAYGDSRDVAGAIAEEILLRASR
ncbi:hypothetical protein [Nesterenkonia lutea]|uniref:Uncharacterized protein n=1 Tax=Nesterenkonia lutea TaxID=272919 RepID=A0ABR9JGA5_9MICC|nr:hypothetical protein [Nesterenkonia lutea]MBE1524876.1 hypothetical protein [Nesterenkonia lutea]